MQGLETTEKATTFIKSIYCSKAQFTNTRILDTTHTVIKIFYCIVGTPEYQNVYQMTDKAVHYKIFLTIFVCII